ncbi:hypothetical protein RUESEDTHA_02735 [Ruegeria sp. THAF57]|uniref:DUF3300 domain-containing protein n=1 Tax=Ruegeria sp. THAF57 TaxID=2744555 RepID=UPI0015DF6B26|nr:DUF3300 domain-containing protein [Ruegeria sp. THAF57]CAD0185835.1 hypothetical protein RUESEDTHA_02735 [Ruegeria sp. THAF57]
MFRYLVLLLGFCAPVSVFAQEASQDAQADDTLLTDAELQTLVAPVALYPDTLLIQIFVAATQPLEIVKAERFLLDNADRDPTELEPEIDAMGWDPSVSVLATAFPEVVGQMATHIDWTETMGTAMLAQSDDVMDAVQVMRDQAIDSGALISGPEQTVEVTEEETVVITPTNTETVYVPQYDPQTVYTGPSTGDVIGTALLTFGAVALIDEIFDDDDDWNDYWGCRNCGGWNGQPIVRNPDIDIDVDGNINIGNEIDRGDRTDIGWTPDPERKEQARDKISDHKRPEGGRGDLPVNRPDGRTDELRAKLSRESGAADISRDRAAAVAAGAGAGAVAGSALANRGGDKQLPKVNRGNVDGDRAAAKQQAIDRTKQRPNAAKKPVKQKPQSVKKPQAKKPVTTQRKPSAAKGAAMKKKSSGNRAKSASKRGHAAKGARRR